jgi:hypothetical protein
VKSPSAKEKYESCKACNTSKSFHVYKSFTEIFGRKNKSEYINGFCLNLLAVLIWSNMSDTIGYLHRTPQAWRKLWLDMSDLGRICLTLVGRFCKMILFRWLLVTLILVDHETSCVGKIILLAFYAYEEHPNQMSYASCASIWKQDGHGLWDWLKVKLCNSELDWISTLVCASPCLSSTLLMSHMFSKIQSFISWELVVSWERKKMWVHED